MVIKFMDSTKFYRFWSLSIVGSVILVIISLFFVSCSKSEAKSAESPSPDINANQRADTAPPPTPIPTVEPISTLLADTEDMGQAYIDSIIFLGDSTTYSLRHYGVLSGGTETTQVWTPENGTFSLFNQGSIQIKYPETGENMSIEAAVALKKPEYMVITLGTNGIAMMEETWFKEEYTALITRILETNPNTKIMLNSMYPVARNYTQLTQINNEKINTGNTWVYSIAEELGLRYLSTASILKDSDGWLPDSYQNSDGMHLTREANMEVLRYIRTHGYR